MRGAAAAACALTIGVAPSGAQTNGVVEHYGVFIGNEDYALYNGANVDVLQPAANATDMLAAFLTLPGWSADAGNHQLLLDQTAAQMRGALLNALQSADGDSVVVFYYSGHGSTTCDTSFDEADGLDETLVGVDNQHFLDDEFRFLVANFKKPGTCLLVILDSCHGGGFQAAREACCGRSEEYTTFCIEGEGSCPSGVSAPKDGFASDLTDASLNRAIDGLPIDRTIVMTAVRASEFAIGMVGQRNSKFTGALLTAFPPPTLTAEAWFAAAAPAATGVVVVNGQVLTQTPQLMDAFPSEIGGGLTDMALDGTIGLPCCDDELYIAQLGSFTDDDPVINGFFGEKVAVDFPLVASRAQFDADPANPSYTIEVVLVNPDGSLTRIGEINSQSVSTGSFDLHGDRIIVSDGFGVREYSIDTEAMTITPGQLIPRPANIIPSAFFGETLSLWGDYALVGAPRDSTGPVSAPGSVFLYRRDSATGVWSQAHKFTADTLKSWGFYGSSVSIDCEDEAPSPGDPQVALVAIGADNEDNTTGPAPANGSGAAYIYEVAFHDDGSTTVSPESRVTLPNAALFERFGRSVGAEYNNMTVVVGAPDRKAVVPPSMTALPYGTVSFFRQNAVTGAWALEGEFAGKAPDSVGDFGFSVAIDENFAVGGAPGARLFGSGAGVAQLFFLDPILNQWTESTLLHADPPVSRENFGEAVAISRDGASAEPMPTIVFGAPSHDLPAGEGGDGGSFSENGRVAVQQGADGHSDAGDEQITLVDALLKWALIFLGGASEFGTTADLARLDSDGDGFLDSGDGRYFAGTLFISVVDPAKAAELGFAPPPPPSPGQQAPAATPIESPLPTLRIFLAEAGLSNPSDPQSAIVGSPTLGNPVLPSSNSAQRLYLWAQMDESDQTWPVFSVHIGTNGGATISDWRFLEHENGAYRRWGDVNQGALGIDGDLVVGMFASIVDIETGQAVGAGINSTADALADDLHYDPATNSVLLGWVDVEGDGYVWLAIGEDGVGLLGGADAPFDRVQLGFGDEFDGLRGGSLNQWSSLPEASIGVGAPCPADLSGDSVVDGADLGLLLGAWGGTGAPDLNGDGAVEGADLGLLLGAWGPCP